uniref:Uncharacterized protein n=1 Tax=Arundo donax TaxID=35708 RepID=A0A0A8YDE0_ARUDO
MVRRLAHVQSTQVNETRYSWTRHRDMGQMNTRGAKKFPDLLKTIRDGPSCLNKVKNGYASTK